MKLITDTKPHKILAEEGMQIRSKNDEYIPEHYDEEGHLVPEHIPYYSTLIYVPDSMTEEMMNDIYVEEEIGK